MLSNIVDATFVQHAERLGPRFAIVLLRVLLGLQWRPIHHGRSQGDAKNRDYQTSWAMLSHSVMEHAECFESLREGAIDSLKARLATCGYDGITKRTDNRTSWL